MEQTQLLSEVGELLRQPLPLKDIEAHIISLDAYRFDLSKARMEAMKTLYDKRKQMLWPRDADKTLTELDRTTRLNGDVSVLERDYQFLKRVEELVDARIELALHLID